MSSRIFVLNEPAVHEHLHKHKILSKLVLDEATWLEAQKEALVMIINPSNTSNFALNPAMFMHEYRDLVRSILLEKAEAPLPKRPWQPAMMVRLDPEEIAQISTLRQRFARLFTAERIHTEGFSVTASLKNLADIVRTGLQRKLVAEKAARKSKKRIQLATWHCKKEPYLKYILQGKA